MSSDAHISCYFIFANKAKLRMPFNLTVVSTFLLPINKSKM